VCVCVDGWVCAGLSVIWINYFNFVVVPFPCPSITIKFILLSVGIVTTKFH